VAQSRPFERIGRRIERGGAVIQRIHGDLAALVMLAFLLAVVAVG
jgi:hypothetical protein